MEVKDYGCPGQCQFDNKQFGLGAIEKNTQKLVSYVCFSLLLDDLIYLQYMCTHPSHAGKALSTILIGAFLLCAKDLQCNVVRSLTNQKSGSLLRTKWKFKTDNRGPLQTHAITYKEYYQRTYQ